MSRAALAFVLTASLLASVGCESDERRIQSRIDDFEAAVVHSDPAGLYSLHVESRGEGVICDERFVGLFEKAGRRSRGDTCAQADRVMKASDEARGDLEDEAVMLLEMVDFHCKRPTEATCGNFSRHLFIKKARASRLFATPVSGLTTTRVTAEGDTAAAYIIVHYEDAEEVKITLRFKRLGEAWLMTSYPW